MKTALGALRAVERTALVTLFLSMVALFFLNVVSRWIGGSFASSMAWIEEAVRILNLYMVFLGLGLALEYGRHVAVDTWREKIAAATRLPVKSIIDVVGLLFSLYVVWLGWRMADFVFGTGQRSPTLDIRMGWIYVAPTIGFALMALRYFLSLTGAIDRFPARSAEDAS